MQKLIPYPQYRNDRPKSPRLFSVLKDLAFAKSVFAKQRVLLLVNLGYAFGAVLCDGVVGVVSFSHVFLNIYGS